MVVLFLCPNVYLWESCLILNGAFMNLLRINDLSQNKTNVYLMGTLISV